jgi:hypothetical protein
MAFVVEPPNNMCNFHRSWARLLATPLKPFQVGALQKYSDYIEKEDDSVQGPLMKK